MTSLCAGAFVLRPFTPSDAPAFAAAVSESMATVGKWMPWAGAGFGEADALTWFDSCESARANGSAHEFGIFRRDGGALVGGAGLNQFNPNYRFCNLGYWVRESAQRQGAALASVAALCRYAFEELALTRVELVIADGNAASIAVARKAGATHECLARNRLRLNDAPIAAHVFSLLPESRA
ncbi:GNAT family N-acetyltransferase [Massilia sp. R2A-15]|uniref:GNAT family N-acetyltransferase n=1 Tax=Massilia sp. R2A-15 TaxID=3064278 RepID=UPI002732A698|nr:GNAT family N-acetyltransferase [Massilia sp. R2A-15]WLI91358.1 GNAT family N-acetyltransferase [Massilia sp. R2A-15]